MHPHSLMRKGLRTGQLRTIWTVKRSIVTEHCISVVFRARTCSDVLYVKNVIYTAPSVHDQSWRRGVTTCLRGSRSSHSLMPMKSFSSQCSLNSVHGSLQLVQ